MFNVDGWDINIEWENKVKIAFIDSVNDTFCYEQCEIQNTQ